MRIGIDLDSVMLDLNFLFETVHARHYEAYQPPVDWKMSNFKQEIREELFAAFRNSRTMSHLMWLHPLGQIQSFMRELKSEGHNLYIISSRFEEVQNETFMMIHAAFGDYYKTAWIKEGSKIEAFQLFKIDIHIDDSPSVIQDCITSKVIPIMISNATTPYNFHMREKVNNCDNLLIAKEFIDIITELKNNER
jgi:uncharacterized HAD superfamily protein